MNVLVFSQLSDWKLFYRLINVANSDKVEKILISRLTKTNKKSTYSNFDSGKFKNKTKVINPLNIWSNFFLLNHLFRLIKILLHIKNNKIKIKKIISVHLYPHGYLAWFCGKILNVNVCHILIAGSREINLFGGFVGLFSRYILESSKEIICYSSNSEKELLKKNIGLDSISVIPNCIDNKLFPNFDIKKDFDLVVVTRFFEIKRLDKLIDIIHQVKANGKKLKCCIIGSGPLLNRILEYSKYKEVFDQIKFIRKLDERLIPIMMNRGKIFLLTSDSEGLPHTLLESMSCGLVPISSNVGDISSVIDNGKNGFLVDGNVAEYVTIIEMLIEDNQLIKKISHSASSSIEKNNSLQVGQKYWNKLIQKW